MMTIKEFAALCQCSTQTLRYYDKIDLLKPVQVDPWSRYRYYTQSQAIDYVKIKNLQTADFAISEIKTLLALPDQRIYEAFDQKILEQTQKLERIKQIQRSYLTEKHTMEKLVHQLCDQITSLISDFDALREFGVAPEEGPNLVALLQRYMEEQTLHNLPEEQDVTLVINDQVFQGASQVTDAFQSLDELNTEDTILLGDPSVCEDFGPSPDEWETIWVRDGWQHVHEFIDTIPPLDPQKEYCFFFQLTDEKYAGIGAGFPLLMISTMLAKQNISDIPISCGVDTSTDGKNHFALAYHKWYHFAK